MCKSNVYYKYKDASKVFYIKLSNILNILKINYIYILIICLKYIINVLIWFINI